VLAVRLVMSRRFNILPTNTVSNSSPMMSLQVVDGMVMVKEERQDNS